MYRQLVHEITETFKKISDEIIGIQKQFGLETKVSTIIGDVQDAEKTKLKLVCINAYICCIYVRFNKLLNNHTFYLVIT